MLYLNQDQSEYLESTDWNAKYAPQAESILQALEDNNKSDKKNYSEIPLLRIALANPVLEYYTVGHDKGMSALAGDQGGQNHSYAILLDKLKQNHLNMYFGGVGDARHTRDRPKSFMFI